MKHFILLLSACFVIALTACSQEDTSTSNGYAQSEHIRQAVTEFEEGSENVGDSFIPVPDAPSTQKATLPSDRVIDRTRIQNKRIAETHTLSIEVIHDELADRYDRDFAKCVELGCEIQSSDMQNRNNGYILARISPEKLGEYLDFVGTGTGELKSHSVNTQDKTLNYIDTEARIKSNEELKVRLVKLLNSAETIESVIQIESELSRVEQALDSAKGTLRHLQTLTDMATVRVNYQVPFKEMRYRYKNLEYSFAKAWQEFITSIFNVITFIGAILPWLPVIALGIWMLISLLRFSLRKREKNINIAKIQTTAESDVDKSQ